MGKCRTRVERNLIALKGAMLMTTHNWTLWQISGEIECPMSSLYKIMMAELPHIDQQLYDETRERLEEHKKWGKNHCKETV